MLSIRIAAALTTSRPVRRTPSVTICRTLPLVSLASGS